jgi:hypothetical protein
LEDEAPLEGRAAAYVQAALTASVVYHLLALDMEPWFLQAVDKLRRGFVWVGKEDAMGGCCLVAWSQVFQPKSLGGLGLHNLKLLNASLRAKWIWYSKTDFERPWSGMNFIVLPDAAAIFRASVTISIGDGAHTLLWEDPWIGGLCAGTVAPAILLLV